MALTATGVSGEIRVGGRVAATLGKWTLTTLGGGSWTATAIVESCDDYWVAVEARRELRLFLGTRCWRFREVDFYLAAGEAHVSGVGKPEIT